MFKNKIRPRPEYRYIVDDLIFRYEKLIAEYSLNSQFLDAFKKRYSDAETRIRNIEGFLEDERKEFDRLERYFRAKREARNGEKNLKKSKNDVGDFADRVLEEQRKRISHYPSLEIHPNADPEVEKLYGALSHFDHLYWPHVESYLRRAFPQAGQLDRMSIEQRFWRFVTSISNRVPAELERYQSILAEKKNLGTDRHREVREAIKSASFLLHELLEVCNRGDKKVPHDEKLSAAMSYVEGIIADFRLKSLKRR